MHLDWLCRWASTWNLTGVEPKNKKNNLASDVSFLFKSYGEWGLLSPLAMRSLMKKKKVLTMICLKKIIIPIRNVI